jgi:hypothetical protein
MGIQNVAWESQSKHSVLSIIRVQIQFVDCLCMIRSLI